MNTSSSLKLFHFVPVFFENQPELLSIFGGNLLQKNPILQINLLLGKGEYDCICVLNVYWDDNKKKNSEE